MTEQQQPHNPRAVFRPSGVLLLVAFFVAVCATPFAFSAPGLQAIYLVPLAIAGWTLRMRTIVDSEHIVVRTLLSRRVLSWSELTGFRITERALVEAVLADESRVPLPTVRTRHVPFLAALSDGRIPDPSEQAADNDQAAASEPAGEHDQATETEPAAERDPAPAAQVSEASARADTAEPARQAGDPAAARQDNT